MGKKKPNVKPAQEVTPKVQSLVDFLVVSTSAKDALMIVDRLYDCVSASPARFSVAARGKIKSARQALQDVVSMAQLTIAMIAEDEPTDPATHDA